MKVYYDAGLKELGESRAQRRNFGVHQKCSSYKRTHQFLFQAWEALYWQMFKAFECARDSDCNDEVSISDIVAAAKTNMLKCNEKMSESECCDPLKEYLKRTREVHSKVHKQFIDWVSTLKEKRSKLEILGKFCVP